VEVDCNRSSGAIFRLGNTTFAGIFPITNTTVTCAATDTHDIIAESNFTVSVHDNSPLISVKDITINNVNNWLIAFVNYNENVSASDVEGPVIVTCNPPSGSIFHLGNNPVTCLAKDNKGYTTNKTFTVHLYNNTSHGTEQSKFNKNKNHDIEGVVTTDVTSKGESTIETTDPLTTPSSIFLYIVIAGFVIALAIMKVTNTY
jgi:hypothetical protein